MNSSSVGLGLLVGAAVGHRLAAAGLVERVVDLDAQFLQQLQGRHPDLRIEHVEVTGNHQSHTRGWNPFRVGRPAEPGQRSPLISPPAM
jgi:hypothetical protein